MKRRSIFICLIPLVAVALIPLRTQAEDTEIQKDLREFLTELFAKAEKAGSIGDFIPHLLLTSDLPRDYPEVGGQFLTRQFGLQMMEWLRDTQSKQATHSWNVESLRSVQAHGLDLHIAMVQETEKATNKLSKTEIYWLKNPNGVWKFCGLEAVK